MKLVFFITNHPISIFNKANMSFKFVHSVFISPTNLSSSVLNTDTITTQYYYD